ncbi:MAG: GNAT family N-acetyltransferase [Treponema sp.]|nr:GNAT family N-acetyltransferase [Treponema sp.]
MALTGELSVAFVSQVPQLHDAAVAFLTQHEKTACSLFERFVLNDKNLYVVFRTVQNKFSCIEGIFLFNGKTVLCQFEQDDEDVCSCLSAFFKDAAVTCVAGQEQSVLLVTRALKKTLSGTPDETRSFMLMECTEPFAVKKNATVRTATEADSDTVLCMHLAFLKEEVAPAWFKDKIEDRESLERRSVIRNISKNMYRLVETDGSIVCAACIDAQTPSYLRISRVYTFPRSRNCGYATLLANHIAGEAKQQHKTAVLYVDRNNTAACTAYKKAGFTPFSAYCICYYKR